MGAWGKMDILQWLQEWYLSQCDGMWEHGYGISIDTLDNPGWKVVVDGQTGREALTFMIDYGDDDWLSVNASAERFDGTGDPGKLAQLLACVKDWVASSADEGAMGAMG